MIIKTLDCYLKVIDGPDGNTYVDAASLAKFMREIQNALAMTGAVDGRAFASGIGRFAFDLECLDSASNSMAAKARLRLIKPDKDGDDDRPDNQKRSCD